MHGGAESDWDFTGEGEELVRQRQGQKLLAELVGREYPQYRIKRTSSCEEKGQAALARQGKYRITCTGCGAVAYRQRASKLIQRPEEFRCGRCGGTLKVEIRRFP